MHDKSELAFFLVVAVALFCFLAPIVMDAWCEWRADRWNRRALSFPDHRSKPWYVRWDDRRLARILRQRP
jgi:hypothetical protein